MTAPKTAAALLRDEVARAIARAQTGRSAAAALESLSASLARAEGERDAAIARMEECTRAAGLAQGEREASEIAGAVDGWKARATAVEAALAQAREDAAAVRREAIEMCARVAENHKWWLGPPFPTQGESPTQTCRRSIATALRNLIQTEGEKM